MSTVLEILQSDDTDVWISTDGGPMPGVLMSANTPRSYMVENSGRRREEKQESTHSKITELYGGKQTSPKDHERRCLKENYLLNPQTGTTVRPP